MNRSILIILYTFPPFPGIGGRRWAKFTKYLALKGYKVHVICSENVFKEYSLWMEDIKNENIKVYTLPSKYPQVMLHEVGSFLDKIFYRFWKMYFSIYSKGVIFERVMFWRKQLQQKASEIIEEENIKNVIVSIPPYRLATYSIALKQKYKYVNLIIDYRDPWTDNKSFHGFNNISPSRLKYEQELEQHVLETADKIISVSSQMSDNLKERNIEKTKVITIPNGFDPSDIFPIANSGLNVSEDKIRFVYGGTLYNDLEYVIIPLISYLTKLKESNQLLYNRLSFEFYGSLNIELKRKLMNSGNSNIHINTPVSLKEMQQILGESSFGLLFTPPSYSVVFNTKFCEYLANRKPILLFSYPCEASDFLIKNKLGFYVNPWQIEKELDFFFDNIDSIKDGFNSEFDLTPFSIPFLTNEIEKLLI